MAKREHGGVVREYGGVMREHGRAARECGGAEREQINETGVSESAKWLYPWSTEGHVLFSLKINIYIYINIFLQRRPATMTPSSRARFTANLEVRRFAE